MLLPPFALQKVPIQNVFPVVGLFAILAFERPKQSKIYIVNLTVFSGKFNKRNNNLLNIKVPSNVILKISPCSEANTTVHRA